MDETASQALAEDPSIFEYDSVYDQMVEEKKNKNPKLSGGSNKVCLALTWYLGMY